MHFDNLVSLSASLFWGVFSRGSGKNGDVFGLVTPLDHPPETTQWVTAWVGGLYILYIYSSAEGCQGKVVEWGPRDQNKHC